jgi:hypothetical protein
VTAQDRLLDKLQKIKAMAEGAKVIGSEAEAQAFADMLNRLLTEHKLEMSDLEFEKLDEAEPVERETLHETMAREKRLREAGVRTRKVRVDWMERLASTIARAHHCRIIVLPGSSMVSLVGRRSDRAVAEYMIVTLTRAAEGLAEKELGKYRWEVYKRDGKTEAAAGFKRAFLRSFVLRLMERFDELRRQRTEASDGSMALMRIDHEQKAADDFMQKLRDDKATQSAPGLRRQVEHHGEGVRRGRTMADGVGLEGKAIETNATNRKELPGGR